MKTKKNILKVLLAGIFIGIASLAAAQQRHPEPPPIPNDAEIAKMIEHISTELKLSDDQKEKIKALHVEHFKQMKAYREKQQIEKNAIKKEMDKHRADFEAKIEKELSKEQFEKFKELRKENHKRKGQSQRPPKK